MTGKETAALLGVSTRTLYRWHAEGRLYVWEWSPDIIEARREELLNPDRPRPEPHCATCGTRNPARFSPHANRPSGYCGHCKKCNAERMRRSRMK